MKKLYDMLVQSGFLKTNVESHLEGCDYCEFHGRDGHHIEDCIEFCEKIAKMLKIGELRIEPMESRGETPLLLFQTKISGLTQSGRCFTPKELRKAKGKEVVDLDKALEINKPVTEEESNEFLKLIKHSEYCIVDQLKKTSTRISLISLILSSKPH
ncbi:hypothetical protein Peur_031994 [Populus x canadensis]